jgi:hypothetical protein
LLPLGENLTETVKRGHRENQEGPLRSKEASTKLPQNNDNLCELLFAYETAADEGEQIIVVEEFRAIMTPRTLKTLQLLLAQVMPRFETAIGGIAMAPGKEEELSKTVEQAIPGEGAKVGSRKPKEEAAN